MVMTGGRGSTYCWGQATKGRQSGVGETIVIIKRPPWHDKGKDGRVILAPKQDSLNHTIFRSVLDNGTIGRKQYA
jgi:hypothetical protein